MVREVGPTAETVEVLCEADLNLEKHCILRLNGIPDSECDPKMDKNGCKIREIILDTK